MLDEEQEELLQDPLGDPLANGYWYVSDGGTYTIWMLRESAGPSSDFACSETPQFLLEKGTLFCVTVSSAAGPEPAARKLACRYSRRSISSRR